ncbi:EamA domain-containing membrane protein RarD [Tistlia consotensis]|uniref:EamA domain-containing membrane protein RarD n=1 Tax=Tistlia consotensis USBA 355 TaxID=560819 RepID=A0A1Y6BM77_9PROT|nr:DMT family transporter [Tistlia consotensis]SMF14562.1 EamA domain-containing membrane protein RarD [Tistlia consotensis USBA 355]SNR49438.1 EamA domain-containing membrane protein RarD [Tistlia consotensis]
MGNDSERTAYGIACVVSASFFTSLAGPIVRAVESSDGWTLQFWRQAWFLAFILLFLTWRHGWRGLPKACRDIGRPGLIGAVAMAISFVAFVFAMMATTVAKVVFIGATSPFLAALFAWIALGERLKPVTWLAMGIALSGIALMAGDGLTSGQGAGVLLCVITVLGFGVTLVCLRSRADRDMLPTIALAGVLALIGSAIMAPSFAISGHDMLLAAIFGTVQLGFQYVLVAIGARHVPAGEVALLGRLQLVLGPLWVWITVDEAPSYLTLVGGAVVVSAIALQSSFALRRRSPITP